jgi:hypothetical protein
MKKVVQFFGFALLIMFSSFTKGNINNNLSINEHIEISIGEKKGSFSLDSSFLKAIQTSESVANQTNFNSVTTFPKDSNFKSFTSTKCIEQVFNFQFSQYSNSEKNFLILSKKTQLIFPFHYHW